MRRVVLNRNGQISPKGRETSDLKAGQFKVGEHVMLAITGDCCYHRKAFEELEVIEVKPCSRFGGGRETVTFQRVPKRPKGGEVMESMIQDMLPGDLPDGADGVEPMSRGERHMSKVEAAAILGRMAATSWVTVDEVTALEMGARRLMNRHFQRQRNWARRHARHVPPLSPEEELAATITRQKEAE